MIYHCARFRGFNPLAFLFLGSESLWLFESTPRTKLIASLRGGFYALIGLFFYTLSLGFVEVSNGLVTLICAAVFVASLALVLFFPKKAHKVSRQDIEKMSFSVSAELLEWMAFCVSMYLMLTYIASAYSNTKTLYILGAVFLALGFVPLAEQSFRTMTKRHSRKR